MVTFTLADVYARTFARELPAWQVIVDRPPCVIVTGPSDALGNSFDTSPIRAHRSVGIARAGTMSPGVTGSPTANPTPPPTSAAKPHPIAVPRTSRLPMPATLTTRRSSLTAEHLALDEHHRPPGSA